MRRPQDLMRIAYIAGATSLHAHKWISHFAKGHDVILLCEENPASLALYASNPEVKILPILPRAYPLRRVLEKRRVVRGIKSAIAHHRSEVIHSMYAVPNSFWAYEIGFKNHIVTTRGSDVLVDYKKMCEGSGGLHGSITDFFLKRTLERALRHARYVTSTSRRQQEAIRHLADTPEKLVLARTGVDVTDFVGTFNRLKASTKQERLIFSNRAMLPNYDIGLIIDAFVQLRRNTGIPARLVTIRYPPDQAYESVIMDKIAQCPLADEISVLSPQSKEQLVQLYKDADVVVMVPRSDGTPVTGVETLLARKPLIMGPLEYDEDLFNPSTVWAIDSRSAEALAGKIAEVLQLPEESICRKTDKGFAAAAEHADLAKELRKIEQLYATLSEELETSTRIWNK